MESKVRKALLPKDTLLDAEELSDGYVLAHILNPGGDNYLLIIDTKAEPPVEILSTKNDEWGMVKYFMSVYAQRKEKRWDTENAEHGDTSSIGCLKDSSVSRT